MKTITLTRNSLGLFLVLLIGGLSAQPWFDTNWGFRRALSNMRPFGGVVLTNFPIGLRFSNESMLNSVHQSTGGDITFVGADGKQLFHEIEYFNKSTGDLSVWVAVPLFTNNTTFFIYYSNASGSLSFDGSNAQPADNLIQSGLPTLRTNLISRRVWDSNFMVVAHMAESSGLMLDSSRYAHSNSALSNYLLRDQATPFGRGVTWPWSGSPYANNNPLMFKGGYQSVNPFLSNMWFGSNYSMSAYVYFNQATGYYYNPTSPGVTTPLPSPANVMVATFRAGGGGEWSWRYGNGTASNNENGGFYGAPTGNRHALSVANQWLYSTMDYRTISLSNPAPGAIIECAVYTNEKGSMYFAGGTKTNFMLVHTGDLNLGAGGGYNWVGTMDEFRLSGIYRGSNWAVTESSNVRFATNGGFFIAGTNESPNAAILQIPVTVTPSLGSGLVTNRPFPLTLTADQTNGFWSTNGGTTWTLIGPAGATVTVSNSNAFLVTGVNSYGYSNAATNSLSYSVDLTNATLVSNSAASGFVTNAPFSFVLTNLWGDGTVIWSTNAGASWAGLPGTWTNVLVSNSLALWISGTNWARVAGPTNVYSYTVTPPGAVSFNASPASGLVTNAPFTVTLSNANATPSTAVWSTNGGTTWTALAAAGTNLVVSNTNTLLAVGTNWQGGVSTNTYVFNVDLTNRLVTTASPASGTTWNSAFALTLTNTSGLGTAIWSTNAGVSWNLLAAAGTNITISVTTNVWVVGTNWAGVGNGSTNVFSYVIDPSADLVVPLTAWTGPTNGFKTNAAFTVSLAVSKSNGWYSSDGSTWTRFGPGATTVSIPSSMTLWFYAANTYGLSTATNSRSYVIDSVAPTLTGLVGSTVTNQSFTLSFSVNEPMGYWSTNNGITTTSFSNASTLLVDRDMMVLAWAMDDSGNSTATNLASYRLAATAANDTSNSIVGLKNGGVIRGSQLSFTFAASGKPVLEIVGLDGRSVRTLTPASGEIDLAARKITWNGVNFAGRKVPAGVYLLVLKVNDKVVDQKKIVLTAE